MGDECDKQFNSEIFVFDEDNHEQKSWKFSNVRVVDPFRLLLRQFSS